MSGSKAKNRRVRVVVRTKATADFAHDMIGLEEDGKTVSICLPKNLDKLMGFINNQQQEWSFKTDGVLHNASEESVYAQCGEEIVSSLMDGYNATIMAYGETGAGKTYTMSGALGSYQLRGIIPRAISQVFKEVRERQEHSITIQVSYCEIYNEVLTDLLSTLPDGSWESGGGAKPPASLIIAENESGQVFVKGLTLRLVRNEEEALNMMFEGETNRSISEHTLNAISSRSHCIFTIYVESRSRTNSSPDYTVSKLNLVDLAGSERLSKTNSSGTIQREAMYINKSLSFLEQVVIALADKKRGHVPYRQSKLTHLLKDSLGGSCQTLMIANIWAEAAQIEETVLVKQYEQEIRALKLELAMHDTMVNRGSVAYEPLSEVDVERIRRQIRQYLDGDIPEIEILSVRQVREVFAQFKSLVQTEDVDSKSEVRVGDRVAAEPKRTPPPSSRQQQTPSRAKGSKPSATVPEIEKLVGEIDGSGLGVGTAPTSMKHPASPVAATRKVRAVNKQQNEVPAIAKKRETKQSIKSGDFPAVAASIEAKDEGQEEKDSLESGPDARPSTPPPRAAAFEQFKQEKGLEIHKILILNKESLSKKRKECNRLSLSINELKRKIDELCSYLEDCRQERERELGGRVTTETGEEVIDEKEFQAITELKQLKAQYREQHDKLQTVQVEATYCKQYVDECRTRLLTEFDNWYKRAFLGESGEETHEEAMSEYEHEKFDRLQAKLCKEDPATMAFYRAQLRTERRVIEMGSKRRPGQPVSTIKNSPPGLLTCS